MKLKEMILNYKNKKFRIKTRVCNSFEKILGLMFTQRQKANALLFKLKKPLAIHSFFVFFPFYAIWLNNKNKILEIKKVKPFTFHIKPKKQFSKIIEIPINKKYEKIIEILQT